MPDDVTPPPPRRTPSTRPRPLRAERFLSEHDALDADAAPPDPPPLPDGNPSAVRVEFEGPTPQRRVTVAFRIILAIPHFLFVVVLNIAAMFTTVIAWFAALFLGRVPDGLAAFIGSVIQYNARVYAYAGILLHDRFPSFSLDEDDAPVNVRFSPGRLNRAAVLFRFILAIPASIVNQLVSSGLLAASVVIWLIVLIRGRLPGMLFEAQAATLRYEIRFWSYITMLTSEYPKRLFGDKPAALSAEPATLPARPKITTLVLSKGAKWLVALFLVVGVVWQVGTNAATFSGVDTGTYDAITAAHADLDDARDRYFASAQGCAASGGLDCIHSAQNRLADGFERFGDELASHKYDSAELGLAEEVNADVDVIVGLLRRLATTSDPAQIQRGAVELQQLLDAFDDDYDDLEYQLEF